MKKIILLALVCTFCYLLPAQIYVSELANGNDNGSSWADAYTDLQTAIYNAQAGDTLWVAEGIYKPFIDTLGAIPQPPATRSFWLKNGVVIYGGFSGSETLLSQRDPVHHKATLEGEIIPGSFAEHVLYVYGNVDSTAVLDGFVVQNGHSVDTSAQKNGSGLMLRGDAQFHNIVFKSNNTYNQGGAVYAEYSAARFVNCRFQSNLVTQYDGGACNFVYSDIEMYNCIFDGNQSGRFGGAITTVESDLLVQNGTFFGNSGGTNIFQFSVSGNVHMNNCIFGTNTGPVVVGNSGATVSFRDGLMPQDNNWLIHCPTCIGATPTFTNLGAGDYSLAAGSRGIDEALTVTPTNGYADYAGNPRWVGTSMDMGAFEYQGSVSTTVPTAANAMTVYPNPASAEVAIQSNELVQAVMIYNLAGQLVQTENKADFSVAPLPAGLYFLQVKTSNGWRTTRMIKE